MARDTNTAQEIPSPETSRSGRLVGWLVSYGLDSSGAAYELRTGRTFLSSSLFLPAGRNGSSPESAERCVVIKDGGISPLHVALLATASHQLFIQDIFSDHGTFIVKAGSGDEKMVAGTCEAGHGDWIRIGERIRFQVCLIDGRRK